MKLRRLAAGLLAGCAAAALAGAALADPPWRVGRISYVEGEVSLQTPDQSDWIWADRNYPVAGGEALWTGDDGRAEIQIPGLEMWLDNQTELDVIDLDYGQTRLSLPQGSADVRVRNVPDGGVRIETPAGEIHLDYPGLYRIDVGAQSDEGDYPPVEVTTFEGSAGAPSPEGLVAVDEGEAALIYAGYDPQQADAEDASIDDWARDREQREQWDRWGGGPDMAGYEELDRYGQFVDTQDYGQVWFPNDVDSDWAPYQEGHWADVQPWGWTWIDNEPWGFAPFHYGRWVRIDGRWGWTRGHDEQRPVYAPALVAFVGLGGDEMGWIPLAPGEAYRPTYNVSDSYLQSLNAAALDPDRDRALRVGEGYRHPAGAFRNAGAAVFVPSTTFVRGAPVRKAIVPVNRQALSAAPAELTGRMPPPIRRPAFAEGGAMQMAPGAGVRAAAPPPARLRAVRSALHNAPAGATRPPAIAGFTLAPRPPQPGAAFIAPAQIRHPEAQNLHPAPAHNGAATFAPGFGGRPAVNAESEQMRLQAQQRAQQQEQMRLQSQQKAEAQAHQRAAQQQQEQMRLQAQQQEQQRLEAQQRAQAQAQQRAAEQEQARQQQEQMRLQAQQKAQADAQQRAAEQEQMRLQAQQQAQQQQEQQRLEAQQRAQAQAQQRAAEQEQARQQQEQMRLQAQQKAQADAQQRAAQQKADHEKSGKGPLPWTDENKPVQPGPQF